MMIDFDGFAGEMIGRETTVVFLVALNYALSVRHHEKHFFTRQQEDAPWVKFTEGKGFVGLTLWEVPDVPDRYMRQDVTSAVIADVLIESPDVMAFPRLGAEYDGMLPAKGTLAELATPIKLETKETIQQALSDAFDRCLEQLNAFLGAYMLVTQDVRVKKVSRQNCRPFVPMLFQHETGEYFNSSIFGARQDLAHFSYMPEFGDEEVWKLAVSLSRVERNDPFSLFADRARTAHRYYRVDGDYASAIITAQIACEVLLNSILLSTEWEKGTDRDVTRPWFEERISFLSRVTRHLQPNLGGNWSSPPGTGISSGLSDLAKLRNEIVHKGTNSMEQEAICALATMDEAEQFVKKRLAVRKNDYPRTALLLLGKPGLMRLGAWDQWIENWMAEHADQEEDWIIDFVNWRDQM